MGMHKINNNIVDASPMTNLKNLHNHHTRLSANWNLFIHSVKSNFGKTSACLFTRIRHAWFACLLSDWATTTGRLLGLATCLPHKNGGISLSELQPLQLRYIHAQLSWQRDVATKCRMSTKILQTTNRKIPTSLLNNKLYLQRNLY